MATLSLHNLMKIFPGGIRAVDDLSLEVADGERVVLAGPSGSGKTTALRLIAGLEEPTGGRIAIDGRVVGHLSPHQRDVAMVFQHNALYPHLSVRGNLAFGLKLRRISRSEIQRRIVETAAMLDIANLLERKPWELSGGQRQRVALGRAIVRRPKIFLLDEPLSHLDAGLREQMRHEIVRLQQDRLGATMIYVTHDQTEAMTLGQRIVVLHEGRVQQIADPDTLYRRPANRFVASLIGSPTMNFFLGKIVECGDELVFQFVGCVQRTESPDNEKFFSWPVTNQWKAALEPYLGKEIILGVRPEHFRLEQTALGENSLKIPAIVEAIESLGAESHLRLRSDDLFFTCRTQSNHGARVGDPLTPAANQDHLYFFDPHTGETLDSGEKNERSTINL